MNIGKEQEPITVEPIPESVPIAEPVKEPAPA